MKRQRKRSEADPVNDVIPAEIGLVSDRFTDKSSNPHMQTVILGFKCLKRDEKAGLRQTRSEKLL